MSHHPLPEKYLGILLDKQEFVLTIMGKDPFPHDPVGIPFCKPDWERQTDDLSSGYHVLASLGVVFPTVRSTFAEPTDYFHYLASVKGVAFLNLSYHSLGGPCRRVRHGAELLQAASVNDAILSKSRHVVLCGEASKYRWYGSKLSYAHEVVHPDVRCRISRFPKVAGQWQSWWSSSAIAQRFGITV